MPDSSGAPSGRLLVRVLGEPHIPRHPAIRGRALRVVVYLACRERPASGAQLMNAIAGGEARARRTVFNNVYEARRTLRQVEISDARIVTGRRGTECAWITDGIVTDLALLRQFYCEALDAPPVEAMDLLLRGVQLVQGPPFDARGFEWAHQVGMQAADSSLLIERATAMLVDVALDLGHVDLARDAASHGLKGVPGNEALYRRRMRAERRAGNTIGIHTAYAELVAFLDSLGIEAAPDVETTALYENLIRSRHGRAA